MKKKITTRELRERFTVVSVGYGAMQFLLCGCEPDYYNAGVYGWNYDAYIFGNLAVVTGYRGVASCRPSRAVLDKLGALERIAMETGDGGKREGLLLEALRLLSLKTDAQEEANRESKD